LNLSPRDSSSWSAIQATRARHGSMLGPVQLRALHLGGSRWLSADSVPYCCPSLW
jgi:hypothetical protein